MSPGEAAFWIGLSVVGLAGSALWSGFETGTYALSRVRLNVRAHATPPNHAAKRLRRALDRPDRLLSTILVGNNACNYAGTLGLAVLLDATGLPEPAVVAVNVALLTPLLLIFGEALPKELFRVNADALPYRLVAPVSIIQAALLFSGALPLLTSISKVVVRLLGGDSTAIMRTGRDRVADLLRESAFAGHISDAQGTLAARALRFGRETVADAMTPWPLVQTLPADASADRMRALATGARHTWLPLIRRDPVRGSARVAGVINQFDLMALHPNAEAASTLFSPAVIGPDLPAYRALAAIKETSAPLAIVEDRGAPIGIVTVRDLFRPLASEAEKSPEE